MAYYAWGLGTAFNNIVEAYTTRIAVFGYSMMIILVINKRSQSENNVSDGIISSSCPLVSFDELKIYHIRRDINPPC